MPEGADDSFELFNGPIGYHNKNISSSIEMSEDVQNSKNLVLEFDFSEFLDFNRFLVAIDIRYANINYSM